ncbi:MAG: peptide chain release factor N(5)-glutamine methyltransferase [Clostridia bacterium]|nr:peptide chain release factor N(5)-glutamine methyltransferase [Clostridia bacterium]
MEKIYSTPTIYGTVFYYGTKCATAYIDEKGQTHLSSKKQKRPLIVHKHFFIRGLEYLVFGLIAFFSNLSQENFNYKVSKKVNITAKQIAIFVLGVFSILLGVFLFGFLPVKLAIVLSGLNYNMFIKRLLVALFKLLILSFVLLSLKLFPAFKQFYRFNASLDYNEKTGEYKKPTNFLNFIICGFFVSTFVVSMIGFTANNIFKPIINICATIICFSLTYELLLILERYNWGKYCFSLFLVTEKPEQTEIYCANCAKYEVKLMRNDIKIENGQLDYAIAYAEAKQKLITAGVYDAADMDWLMCEVLGCKRSELKFKSKITQKQYKDLQNAVTKRAKGCPITKIFGRTEFYGLEFKVTKDVLSPRMETEILVEEVLKKANSKSEVLDIGTGSGVIAICVSKFSGAKTTAVDVSQKALAVAKQNAENNGAEVQFVESNLFEGLKKPKKYDIIVSNPPYIKSEDIEGLDVEVKDYDPKLALDGGKSGLEFYEKIINNAPKYLKNKGYIFFEIGKGQKAAVEKMLEQNFCEITAIKDYNKIYRVICAKLKTRGIKNVKSNRKN